MNRKIIIKAEDLNREICSFLTEVGADMPVDWNTSAIGLVRNAVIEAYKRMGIHLEVDDRPRALYPPLPGKGISEKKGQGLTPMGSLSKREWQSTGRGEQG